MDKIKILKSVGTTVSGMIASNVTDFIAPRPEGMNPNAVRCIAIAVAAVGMQFAEAAIERYVDAKMS